MSSFGIRTAPLLVSSDCNGEAGVLPAHAGDGAPEVSKKYRCVWPSDLAALDNRIARRVKHSVERFAETGAGTLNRLLGIDPPEFRLRAGDFLVRSHNDGETVIVLCVRNRREAYR